MGVSDFTVYDFICRNARIYPERECIVFTDRRITHRQFRERCDSLAAGLKGAGVEQGDRLAVVAHNSDEFMILYGAAAKIGAIVLPVNWRSQQKEVEFVLTDGSPKFAFAGPEYRKTSKEAATGTTIEQCFALGGGDLPEGFRAFEELYSDGGVESGPPVPADTGFVIIHTAAVAGRPRGALLSQSNIVHCNLQMMLSNGLGPDDCFLCILPLFHIAALSMAMATMHAGGKIVILERFNPEEALELIARERVTNLTHFPPILQMLLQKYEEAHGAYDLSSIRDVGGLDSPDNILKFKKIVPHARFWTGFGQTEAFPVTGGLMEDRPGSAGRPSPLASVTLFDDYDNEVPTGTPGEICVRSPVVFLGYWGLDEDTALTFRNGWHHTGDIGRFDEDGYLWYVKRKAEKELIKPGGENVYPAEVEKVILGHGHIREVCVIGVPDETWGEAIKAVCVLEAGKKVSAEELIEFVAARIARYKKPKHVVFVDVLPKTKEGEVDREGVKQAHGGKY